MFAGLSKHGSSYVGQTGTPLSDPAGRTSAIQTHREALEPVGHKTQRLV